MARFRGAGLHGIRVLSLLTIEVFGGRSSAVQVHGDQMARLEPKSPSQKPKASAYGELPSAWGMLGGARLYRGRPGRGHGARAVEFRPPRKRLSVFSRHVGRSGRLCAAVRARPQV